MELRWGSHIDGVPRAVSSWNPWAFRLGENRAFLDRDKVSAMMQTEERNL